jgi:hypothetical protein
LLAPELKAGWLGWYGDGLLEDARRATDDRAMARYEVIARATVDTRQPNAAYIDLPQD